MGSDIQSSIQSDGLADILERIIDKGVVIAGDVTVSLVGIELLSIKLRLLIASVDKAKELGINWWEHDPMLTARPAATLDGPNMTRSEILERIAELEKQLASSDA
ncbi:MAG: gas vesicle protein GvpJ [Pseudomonadota bacterium]